MIKAGSPSGQAWQYDIASVLGSVFAVKREIYFSIMIGKYHASVVRPTLLYISKMLKYGFCVSP